MKVVDLGRVRDLRAEWDRVRAAMDGSSVTDFYVALRTADGHETVFLGGVYKADPSKALHAALRISAARALKEDPPPARIA